MAGDIGNSFCTAPCAENIWSWCGADFGTRCGAVVVLKWILYGLKTESNSFHKYFVEFLIDLVFTPFRSDQDVWIRKSDEYEGYDYIATHMADVSIADKNPSKYMHDIEMHLKGRDITDSPNYYPRNEMVQFGDRIHVSSKKYVNEILNKYQKTHGDLKKEVLPMRVTGHLTTCKFVKNVLWQFFIFMELEPFFYYIIITKTLYLHSLKYKLAHIK